MPESEIPALSPWQCCFVVDDVAASVASCEARFGWGPFQQFSAPVDDASYRGWTGHKLTDVALGMAGKTQIEFIHVHEGHDAVETYQAEYGRGFQHLGVRCRSRDAALDHLEALGAKRNELLAYSGIQIAFVDIPTGDAMFELLQPAPREHSKKTAAAKPRTEPSAALAVDRATIATADIDAALRFYSAAFGWTDAAASPVTLRYRAGNADTNGEVRLRRFVGHAGTLDIELVEAAPGGNDPYTAHLRRGAHGLVHAGAVSTNRATSEATLVCEWIEDGENFELHDWEAGSLALRA
jgi:catechol 2,3-dioxygenase-like lactoylglutathione lyase family enzyme